MRSIGRFDADLIEIVVVRVIAEWSTELGHHVVDGIDVHDHPPLLVPSRRR